MPSDARRFLFETFFDPEESRQSRVRAERRQAAGETAAKARAGGKAGRSGKAAAPAEVEEVAPPPPEPKHTDEDLERVRQQAYAEGEKAGRQAGLVEGETAGRAAGVTEGRQAAIAEARAEAQATAESALAQALTKAQQQIERLIAGQQRADAAFAEQAVGVARAIAGRLFPDLARRHGLGEVEAVVRACLDDLRGEPRVTIRVAEALAEPLRDRLGALARDSGYDGSLNLVGDAEMTVGDCKVEWADGVGARLSGEIWHAADAAIERVLGHPPPRPTVDAPPPASPAMPGTQPDPTPDAADPAAAAPEPERSE